MSRRLASLAVAVSLALTACAPAESDKPEREPKVLTASAGGATIEGTGYTIRAPKGWVERKVRIPGVGKADTHLFAPARDGFSDNVSIVLADPDDYDPEHIESSALNEMGVLGATGRRTRRPVLVAGDPATHVSARLTKNRVKYVVEQYHPVQGDQVYLVTFSFRSALGRAKRDKVAESVLSTWAWTE